MPDTPTLDVIIVNWNTRELLARCLASLEKFPPVVPYTVWVVDNGSQDGSAAFVREQFPAVQLIENAHNAGFARANNQAIQLSRSDFVLLLNSDAEVHSGSLDTLIDVLASHPAAGIVSPMLLNPDGSFQASFARFPNLWSELCLITRLAQWSVGPNAPSPSPVFNEVAHRVEWVPGTAVMTRRTAIDEVGGLDEHYFMYSEDTDWCWRMSSGGWDVWYAPDAKVTHIGSASSNPSSPERYVRLYAGKLQFLTRAYGTGYGLIARLVLIIAVIARCALWAATRPLPGLNGALAYSRWKKDAALLRFLALGTNHAS